MTNWFEVSNTGEPRARFRRFREKSRFTVGGAAFLLAVTVDRVSGPERVFARSSSQPFDAARPPDHVGEDSTLFVTASKYRTWRTWSG